MTIKLQVILLLLLPADEVVADEALSPKILAQMATSHHPTTTKPAEPLPT
ncbi:MAG: hypothetical protein LBP53_01370 [Candidatus Peribacteria bacterium]|nr:hypothetical protein [Candidatus Peribacteria bacterium]